MSALVARWGCPAPPPAKARTARQSPCSSPPWRPIQLACVEHSQVGPQLVDFVRAAVVHAHRVPQ
eukprot:7626923-Pyramimonas_sp.AAC.1